MTDPTRCKERVYGIGVWHDYQCNRKAWKDGYCKQHHPDTVAERRRKSDEKYEKLQENSPWNLLRKANERIKELEAEVERLKTKGDL